MRHAFTYTARVLLALLTVTLVTPILATVVSFKSFSNKVLN